MSQHEAARKAFVDAQKQMDDILRRTETKTAAIENIQSDLGKKKFEALEARKVEQVSLHDLMSFLFTLVIFSYGI